MLVSSNRLHGDPHMKWGHTFQTRPGFKWHGMTEVTNNVHSLYVQTQWGECFTVGVREYGGVIITVMRKLTIILL